MKNPEIHTGLAICIGLHKSGTSWLFEQCYNHSQLHTLHRDSHVFIKEKDLTAFKSSLVNNFLNIEFGNHYITKNSAMEKMAQSFPTAKFFAIIRNPLDRAISHHLQNIKIGSYPKSTTIVEAVKIDENILTFSMLETHVSMALSILPKDQLLFLDFNSILENPVKLLTKLQVFLQLELPFDQSIIDQKINSQRLPRSVRFEQFQNTIFYRLQQNQLGKILWNLLKKSGVGKFSKKLNTAQNEVNIQPSDIEYLEQRLSNHIEFYRRFKFDH